MSEAMDRSEVSARAIRKRETQGERVERLERQLANAKTAARAAEQRRLAIIGGAVMAEAASDAELNTRFVDILRRRVTSSGARSEIADLLV